MLKRWIRGGGGRLRPGSPTVFWTWLGCCLAVRVVMCRRFVCGTSVRRVGA